MRLSNYLLTLKYNKAQGKQRSHLQLLNRHCRCFPCKLVSCCVHKVDEKVTLLFHKTIEMLKFRFIVHRCNRGHHISRDSVSHISYSPGSNKDKLYRRGEKI
jgi:hypothetical protein